MLELAEELLGANASGTGVSRIVESFSRVRAVSSTSAPSGEGFLLIVKEPQLGPSLDASTHLRVPLAGALEESSVFESSSRGSFRVSPALAKDRQSVPTTPGLVAPPAQPSSARSGSALQVYLVWVSGQHVRLSLPHLATRLGLPPPTPTRVPPAPSPGPHVLVVRVADLRGVVVTRTGASQGYDCLRCLKRAGAPSIAREALPAYSFVFNEAAVAAPTCARLLKGAWPALQVDIDDTSGSGARGASDFDSVVNATGALAPPSPSSDGRGDGKQESPRSDGWFSTPLRKKLLHLVKPSREASGRRSGSAGADADAPDADNTSVVVSSEPTPLKVFSSPLANKAARGKTWETGGTATASSALRGVVTTVPGDSAGAVLHGRVVAASAADSSASATTTALDLFGHLPAPEMQQPLSQAEWLAMRHGATGELRARLFCGGGAADDVDRGELWLHLLGLRDDASGGSAVHGGDGGSRLPWDGGEQAEEDADGGGSAEAADYTERAEDARELYEGLRAQLRLISPRQEANWAQLRARRAAVEKDVVRTDRQLGVFRDAGGAGVATLRQTLLLHGLYNFDMPYAQGMSDVVSVVLGLMRPGRAAGEETPQSGGGGGDGGPPDWDDERVFTCYRLLLERTTLHTAFSMDDVTGVPFKLRALQILVRHFAPELHAHLRACGIGDLSFCLRWFIGAFKREFAVQDIPRLWDVLLFCPYTDHFDVVVAAGLLRRLTPQIVSSHVEVADMLQLCHSLSGKVSVEEAIQAALTFYWDACQELQAGGVAGSDGQNFSLSEMLAYCLRVDDVVSC